MIRPSLLNWAELCGYVAQLAERYPEEGDAAEDGKAIHDAIKKSLLGGGIADAPEVRAAVRWLCDNFPADEHRVEEKVALIDDLDTITEGTPDVVSIGDCVTTVIDWKTGRMENVPDVDQNLQLIAYGLAACDGRPFRCVLVFLDGDKATDRFSRVFEPSEHTALLARVKAAASREPVPHPGDHCQGCWQRQYCHAWQVKVTTALAGVAASPARELTTETAPALAERIKLAGDWLEAAKAVLKDYVRGGGKCVVNGKQAYLQQRQGRASADVKALEADGLIQYVKQGEPYEQIGWRKA